MTAACFVCVKMTLHCPNCKALSSYYIVPNSDGMVQYTLMCDYCGHTSSFKAPLYIIRKPAPVPQALPG